MKTKVAIKGAEFFAYHGYYSEERKSGNTFIIDAEVTLKSFDSHDDNIFDTVNYEQLYTICKQEMSKTQKLLETVVLNIINRYKDELPNIVSATVRMEKLAPQLGGKVAKSVVEMEY
ncbi:MAG: dihydroneopterin aldolase [Saprospiraceae bacterium]|jgi:dihydroneopterin aldolase|nr:dihydroneopterin aldolase [Saprospiraceae bacterium]MBP6539588.1 dihydroneopterin aldolase [Saprospiraceae bacterium]